MSFEHLLQTTPSAAKEESKPVSPTLMIGLGGTGKDVLLRFRRQVVERYGALSALPFVQYIHVDTDTTANAKEQYDQPSSGDPLFEEIQFRPSERINLTIEGGTGKYVEHSRSYPQIQPWFPTSGKIAGLGNLGEGAGQVRIASRLGFYHAPNFQEITASLDHARQNLSDPKIASQASERGFDFDPEGKDVFVICSIAGGTGGGTFLDMGFLLQRYFDNANTVGILMLPSFFTGYAGGKRTQANGYAALMELNHHAFGEPFVANWDGTKTEQIPPPPFDVTYLVDGTNEASLGIPSSGGEMDAYQMVADVLFQDYSLGSFAGKKRATRINLVNFCLDVYSHNFLNDALSHRGPSHQRNVVGDTYPTRFGSFGFSSIEFPTDRVHSACGARMATEILDLWGNALLDDPLERLFTEFLADEDVRFAQGRFERTDGGGVVQRSDVGDALLVYQESSGQTFPSYLWEKAQQICQRVESTAASQKAAVLEEERRELDRLFSHEDSEDPDEWGVAIRQLDSNKRRYLESVRSGIERRARETADNPKYGVAYTLSLLRELKSLLRNEDFLYLHHFESEIEYWRDEVQRHRYDFDQLALDISRHESQFLFRSANLSWDLEQLVNAEDEDDPGALFSYYYSRVMKQVAKRGREVCREIEEFLGKDDVSGDGLLASYWKLLSGFRELHQHLDEKRAYFRRKESNELLVSLYQESDCDRWYDRWVGEGRRRKETLERVGNQLLQEVFQVDSVTEAMAKIQSTPSQELEKKILARCKSFFADQDKQPEALELLMESRWDGQREQMVKRAYNLAKVWLKRAGSGLEHVTLKPVVTDQRPCLIGVDTSNSLRFPDFERMVKDVRSSNDSPPSFQNIGSVNRGRILFYNELAGVPAFYPEAVTRPGGLQAAYLGWEDKDDLHFHKNRFQYGDLIPKTDEQSRAYAGSVKAFVLARALGLLRVRNLRDEESDQTISYFSYSRGTTLDAEEISLGTEAEAIDALYRDQRPEHHTDRRKLLEEVDETVHQIRSEGLLWAYWMLLDFYMYQVYPPNRSEKWVSNLTVIRYSPEHAVLAAARDQIQEMLPSEEERRQLEKALDAKRRGKKAEEMNYDDYDMALSSYAVSAGKFESQNEGLVLEKRTYQDALAFDLGRLRGEQKVYPEPQREPEEDTKRPLRPCPNCGQSIDARAAFCIHCRQMVAEKTTCGTCHADVPSDLDECWSCGARMRQGKKVECPQCRAWSGYEDDFPCPQCGYDPAQPEALGTSPADASTPIPSSADPANPSPASEPETSEPSAPSEPEKVECPTCFELVEPGPKCPVCDGLL